MRIYTKKNPAAILDAPMLWEDMAREILEVEEGFRSKQYLCPANKVTIGFGQQMATIPDQEMVELLNSGAMTIDEEEDFHITMPASRTLLLRRITELHGVLDLHQELEAPIKSVCISMAYQMGARGFFGFPETVKALKRGDWETMADEMLDSEWFRKDTPGRAKRMAAIVREYGQKERHRIGA